MPVAPDLGFLLAVSGMLALYGELIRPGRFVPGLAGAALLTCGAYWLWQDSPRPIGLALIALSALLFATEALIHARFLAGLAGTGALALGASLLFDGKVRIDTFAACALSTVLGAVTTVLAHAARRAKHNKLADVANDP